METELYESQSAVINVILSGGKCKCNEHVGISFNPYKYVSK